MDYDDSPRSRKFAARTREFIDEVVIPIERDCLGDGHVSTETWQELQEAARDYEVFAPHLPEKYDGHDLSYRECFPCSKPPDGACSDRERFGSTHRTRGTCTRSRCSGPMRSRNAGSDHSYAGMSGPDSR